MILNQHVYFYIKVLFYILKLQKNCKKCEKSVDKVFNNVVI